MTHLAEEQVKEILEPHHAALHRIVLKAWDDWRKCPDMAFKRSRANVVWDYMIKYARVEFEDAPGVLIKDQPNSCYLYFEPGVVLRFKKGDDNNLSKNFPTSFALDFNDPQITLPAIPNATRVEVLYHPDREGAEIEWVRVAKRNRDQVDWCYNLGAETAVNVHGLDFENSEKKEKTKTKVSPKKHALKNNESTDHSSG